MPKLFRFISVFCLIVIAAFDAIIPVYAQNLDEIDSSVYWLNFGFGASTSEIAVGGSFSFLSIPKNGFTTIRFIRNEKLDFFSTPAEAVWDFGVLYGRIVRGPAGFISLSGGVAAVGGVRRGKPLESEWFSNRYERNNFGTIGLPVDAQLFLKPFPAVGIGLIAFANLNNEESFAGALFCLQIGKFK